MEKLDAVPLKSVTIADQFWAPRRETNRTATLWHNIAMCEKTGRFKHFELAAEGARTGYEGFVFNDSDTYKLLEACAYALETDPDPALDTRVDEIIALVASAQRPDGYLNTYYEIKDPDARFTNLADNHELYCAGHLFEAAATHYRATGKTNLLDIATRFADLMVQTFGDGPGQRVAYDGHPEVELALIRLWKVTGNRAYFDLARFFVEHRGEHFFAREKKIPEEKFDGAYWQDNVPIREHRRIVGHAVRAAYLFAGVADVARETDDASLVAMLDRVWKNTTQKNLYVTGGIGPSAHNEGFTTDYDLPNDSAYQETCASIAMVFWAHRMALLHGDARYADVMEQTLYNGFLSGVSLDGEKYFYVNPLATEGQHNRQEWFGCACCPPNIARLLADLPEYVAATGPDALYISLFAQGEVHATIAGQPLSLKVTTDYPWDGRVKFAVETAPAEPIALKIRIPGWVESPWAATVNGHKLAAPPVEKGYLTLRQAWKPGDTVTLSLPMPVRRIAANPQVKADVGKLAIARGPLIYCMEEIDQQAPIETIALPADAPLEPTRDPLFGGIVALTGTGRAASETLWQGGLYHTAAPPQPTPIKAIPYAYWDNRTPCPMAVWIPTAPPPPTVGGLERRATPTLSFANANASPLGLNDGRLPERSNAASPRKAHFWPHKGGTEWAQYTWEQPVTLGSARVFWFDDTGTGQCRVPLSWYLLYRDGGEWKPVPIPPGSAYPVAIDQWCEVQFPPITTTELRLDVVQQDGWSSGIHEWQVFAPEE